MNIPYRLFVHPGPVHSLEQAAEERGQAPEQIIRSILFRLAQGEYVMVLMAGPQQISWTALRSYIGRSRLTMAKREEVLQATGYELGAVAPFGLPQPMRVLADPSIFTPDEVSIGSGVRGTTIVMQTADLRRALPDVEIVELQE
jgi:prolyl-tRNA editing enzyme YbaK/EbsC (Cys-tRNA(Pro) deacylase)